MLGSDVIQIWLIALTLVLLTGLNPMLGVVALSLTFFSQGVAPRPEFDWAANPRLLWLWALLLALQFLADLYFVPATVRDQSYLQLTRVVNAYLHARLQSFVRPLTAAIVLATLPTPLAAQSSAVMGFIGGTAVYWLTAWIREQVAISRGSFVLLLLEMLKNLGGLMAAVLVGWAAPLSLIMVGGMLAAAAWWAERLRREQSQYPPYGGKVAPEDS
jgi:hypothetical protein